MMLMTIIHSPTLLNCMSNFYLTVHVEVACTGFCTYKLSFLAPVCANDDDLCIVIEVFGDTVLATLIST